MEQQDERGLIAYRVDALREGGCNFCMRDMAKVTMVRGEGRTLVVRFCDKCLTDLKRQTR